MSSNKSSRWFSSAFDAKPAATVKRSDSLQTQTAADQPAPKKPKLAKTNSFSHVPARSLASSAEPHQIDWSVDLAPKAIADLAVHPKKLEELQGWFKTYDRVRGTDPVAILLISGPPGSAKSTAIKAVAKELGYQVAEWTTPVDVDLYFHDNYDFENDREQITFRESQKKLFDKFLYKTSRYCSIFETASDQKLLLVKDFPNAFLRDPEAFKNSLEAYRDAGASPLVFLVSDTSNKKLDIVYNLFPPDILNEFRIHHVTFNSISATLMKKAVKRLTSLMVGADMARHYRVPSQEMIDSIILSSQGDLRSATLNLHFASLKNAPRLATEAVSGGEVLNSSRVATGRAKKKESKLKSVGSNESLTLMHALGRVFNPKFERVDKDGERFHHSPENLADAFVSQPGAMISLIHSNYVMRFTDIDDIIGAADALSLSDVIMSEYREDQLTGHGLNILVRGMMISNRKTASGWQQIRKKKAYNKPTFSNHEKQLKKFGLETSLISAGLFMTDYKKYLDIIQAAKV